MSSILFVKAANSIQDIINSIENAKKHNTSLLNYHVIQKIVLSEEEFIYFENNLLLPNTSITPYCSNSVFINNQFNCIEISTSGRNYSIIAYYSSRTIPLYIGLLYH